MYFQLISAIGNNDNEDKAEEEDDNEEEEDFDSDNEYGDVGVDETDGEKKDDQDVFVLPGEKSMAGQNERGKLSPMQQRMNRGKEEMQENKLLIGTVAKKFQGRNRGTHKYIIGDYIYAKHTDCQRADGSKVLHLICSTDFRQCKGRAHIDPQTNKVLKFPRLHSCSRDPDRKLQMEMENEMRSLAETTSDSPKDIYDRVCLKYPYVASKLEFHKCKSMMQRRRNYVLRAQN